MFVAVQTPATTPHPHVPGLIFNMPGSSLTDLPPELLDHITTYVPTAQSVKNLGSSSKSLHAFVEKDAWATLSRTRFPSLHPLNPPSRHQDVVRTLTTLSKAWDRRAFVARYIEPTGDIRAFPGDKRIQRWKRPRGQTIGFTPQLDCFEEIGSSWRERREVLAFGAGAEVCVRERSRGSGGKDYVRWMTYRPLSAVEGRDDVTSLHLLKPREGEESKGLDVVTGTANGDLQLLTLPAENGAEVLKTYFTTQGQPVRSSSLLQQPFRPTLLAANIGNTKVNLYEIHSNQPKVAPISQLDILPPPNGHRTYRAWSTNFLSPTNLAVGLGPSEEPIHIYSLTPSGLSKDAVRKFSLQNDLDRLAGEITLSGSAKKSTSSVYPIVPLPPFSTAGGSSEGSVFLSGAYDGMIRLHDLRSNQQVEQAYADPTDDSAIYSLLPRGQETLVAGTSRHSLLKVFDLRLGAKAYSYLDATPPASSAIHGEKQQQNRRRGDWNLFLKPHSATYPGRGGGNNWARRSAESSIYSLACPSPHSPYLYAGVENAVLELAFTSILDKHPDPTFFADTVAESRDKGGGDGGRSTYMTGSARAKEVLDLAMYDQGADMKLMRQRSLWETLRVAQHPGKMTLWKGGGDFVRGLDERWRAGGS